MVGSAWGELRGQDCGEVAQNFGVHLAAVGHCDCRRFLLGKRGLSCCPARRGDTAMSVIAVLRALAGRVANAAEGRDWTTGGKRKGQDKSACHEYCKSLTGLAFSRAWICI